MGKRSRRRVTVPQAPATDFVGRVKESWQVAGQRPAASGLVEVTTRPRERPVPVWGGFPLTELAILAGIAVLVIGATSSARALVIAGLLICGLGVLEVTAREHFAGYRSHTLLLALLSTVPVHAAIVTGAGSDRLGLVVDLVVFVSTTLLFRAIFASGRARADIARRA